MGSTDQSALRSRRGAEDALVVLADRSSGQH
jgi:hypothetical protein